MDVQVFATPVCQGIGLDLLDALFDAGKTDQFVQLFLTLTDIDQRCSQRYQKSQLIDQNQLSVNFENLIFRLITKNFCDIDRPILFPVSCLEHISNARKQIRFAQAAMLCQIFVVLYEQRRTPNDLNAMPKTGQHFLQLF